MIDKIYAQFPEIYREVKSNLSGFRLIFAAVVIAILTYLIYLASFHNFGRELSPIQSGTQYLTFSCTLQLFSLVFFGMSHTLRSISEERVQKTWDYQRLTPLGPWRIVLGKMLSASLYSIFLFLCFVPGQIWALSQAPELLNQYSNFLLQTLSAMLAALSVGLIFSAYADKPHRGTNLLIFLAVYLVIPNATFKNSINEIQGEVKLFAFEITNSQLVTISSFLIAFWATLGAKWRVGQNLLEKSQFWRLPSFLAFLYLYSANLAFRNPDGSFDPSDGNLLNIMTLLIPVLVLMVATLDPLERNQFRKIISRHTTLKNRLDSMPSWVLGCATVLISSLLIYFFKINHEPKSELKLVSSLLLIPLFLIRDSLVLQWMVWLRIRSAGVFSLLTCAMLYAIPAIFFSIVKDHSITDSSYLFAVFFPVIAKNSSLLLSTLPVTLQIVLLVFLLKVQLQKNPSNQTKAL